MQNAKRFLPIRHSRNSIPRFSSHFYKIVLRPHIKKRKNLHRNLMFVLSSNNCLFCFNVNNIFFIFTSNAIRFSPYSASRWFYPICRARSSSIVRIIKSIKDFLLLLCLPRLPFQRRPISSLSCLNPTIEIETLPVFQCQLLLFIFFFFVCDLSFFLYDVHAFNFYFFFASTQFYSSKEN